MRKKKITFLCFNKVTTTFIFCEIVWTYTDVFVGTKGVECFRDKYILQLYWEPLMGEVDSNTSQNRTLNVNTYENDCEQHSETIIKNSHIGWPDCALLSILDKLWLQ